MKLNVFTGKKYDDVLKEALETLNMSKEEVIVSRKEKKSLFKN